MSGTTQQIMPAWVLSSGVMRLSLKRNLGSGRKSGCLQGELAYSRTENLRIEDLKVLEGCLHSRATEQNRTRIHFKLILQQIFDLGCKFGVIYSVVPS